MGGVTVTWRMSVVYVCVCVVQSPNARTDPQQKIRRITDTWPSDDKSPFFGIRPQQPLAKLHVRRLSAQVTPPPGSGSSTSFRCQDTADEDLTEAVDDPFAGLTDMEKQKLMMMQQQDGQRSIIPVVVVNAHSK